MGARLGRYVVLKHLASGGMADVLLGRAEGFEGFERHVVLKRIKPEHSQDQRFIRMFLDEARVAANLHHQHIVQVHDIGESAGEYFIAMEYLHGEDVRTMLATAAKQRQHVPLGCAIAIVSAAAAGLHYAHERRGSDKRSLGIVHRDISPSNILVGYDGSIKVVDFGIAKASARQETRSGSLKGKVSYMSPEQCMSGEVDRRSDVYSLGVVLYELATTTRLFKGENDYLVMDQIVNGRVALPQVRRPELPNELSAIVMRAISPDLERRYATADELRLALDQFASSVGLTASTSSVAAYMRKQFGDKAEPWLELGGQLVVSLDTVGGAAGSVPGRGSGGWRPVWTSEPGGDAARLGSAAVPRPVAPIGSGPNRISAPRTDSKMGWESQRPVAPAPRSGTAAKRAIVVAPLLALVGAGIWWFAEMREDVPASRSAAEPAATAASTAQVAASAAQVAASAAQAAASNAQAAASNAASATPNPPPTSPRGAPVTVAGATVTGAAAAQATAAPGHAHGSESPPGDSTKHGRKTSGAKIIESLTPSSTAGDSHGASGASASAGAPSAASATVSATGAPSATSRAGAAPSAPSRSGGSPSATSSPTTTLPASTAASGSATAAASSAKPAPGSSLLASLPASAGSAPTATAAPAGAAGPAAAASPPPPAPVAPRPPVAAAPAIEAGPAQLSHSLVDRVASDHTRELSKCDGGEDLRGEITVRFTVDASGRVTKAQVATAVNKPKVAACILRSVQKWQFPSQGTTGAQGTYTLSFQ